MPLRGIYAGRVRMARRGHNFINRHWNASEYKQGHTARQIIVYAGGITTQGAGKKTGNFLFAQRRDSLSRYKGKRAATFLTAAYTTKKFWRLSTMADFELLTADKVAEMFNISKATLYRYIQQGFIKATKAGRGYYFTADNVREFMERGGKPRKQRAKKGA